MNKTRPHKCKWKRDGNYQDGEHCGPLYICKCGKKRVMLPPEAFKETTDDYIRRFRDELDFTGH